MTRVGALPERVDLLRRDTSGRDGRNNEVAVVATTLAGIPARVDIRQESEDINNRDRKTETATVIIPAQWHGTDLGLDAHDALIFEDNVYELIGDAIEARDHAGRLDHYELTARRITG